MEIGAEIFGHVGRTAQANRSESHTSSFSCGMRCPSIFFRRARRSGRRILTIEVGQIERPKSLGCRDRNLVAPGPGSRAYGVSETTRSPSRTAEATGGSRAATAMVGKGWRRHGRCRKKSTTRCLAAPPTNLASCSQRFPRKMRGSIFYSAGVAAMATSSFSTVVDAISGARIRTKRKAATMA
jgi:hypothetical protein